MLSAMLLLAACGSEHKGDGAGLAAVTGTYTHPEEGTIVLDADGTGSITQSSDPVTFTLPPRRFGATWEVELQTADPDVPSSSFPARGQVVVEARSIALMRAA